MDAETWYLAYKVLVLWKWYTQEKSDGLISVNLVMNYSQHRINGIYTTMYISYMTITHNDKDKAVHVINQLHVWF